MTETSAQTLRLTDVQSPTILMSVKDPIDAAKSLQRVVEVFRRRGGRVLVLHVHQVDPDDAVHVAREHAPDDPCIAAIVAHTLAGVGVAAVPMTVEAPYGQLPETIVDVALATQAAVVVVGDCASPFGADDGLSDELRRLIAPASELIAVHHW